MDKLLLKLLTTTKQKSSQWAHHNEMLLVKHQRQNQQFSNLACSMCFSFGKFCFSILEFYSVLVSQVLIEGMKSCDEWQYELWLKLSLEWDNITFSCICHLLLENILLWNSHDKYSLLFFSREFLDYASSNNLEIEWSSLLHFCIVFDFSLLQNDVRYMLFLWFKRYRSGLLGLLMFKSGITMPDFSRFPIQNSIIPCILKL